MLCYVCGWMGKGKLFLGFVFIEIWELGFVGMIYNKREK